MLILSKIFVMVVAIEHLYILYLEMVIPSSKKVSKVFNIDYDYLQIENTIKLFKNQGLYNGFIAVGLMVSLYFNVYEMMVYLLFCVVVAALYGGFTSTKKILLIQGLPAVIALIFVLMV
jgi:putative membrane protein